MYTSSICFVIEQWSQNRLLVWQVCTWNCRQLQEIGRTTTAKATGSRYLPLLALHCYRSALHSTPGTPPFKMKISCNIYATMTHFYKNGLRLWSGTWLAARRLVGFGTWSRPSPWALTIGTRPGPRFGVTATGRTATVGSWAASPSAARTSVSSMWRCGSSVAGHLYSQLPSVQHTTVHGIECIFGIALIIKSHECKSAAFSGEAIPGDINIADFAAAFENPA